jgi:hypothetical protein
VAAAVAVGVDPVVAPMLDLASGDELMAGRRNASDI